MTVAVVWFNEAQRQIWCAADSRLSKGAGVLMDGGVKVFEVPVVCRKEAGEFNWVVTGDYSFGFVFSGSSISALSTHAIVVAMSKNLVERQGEESSICLEDIAKLFQFVGERQIKEIGERLGATEHPSSCLFDCVVFGICPKKRALLAFEVKTSIAEGVMSEIIVHEVGPGFCLAIGSGAETFNSMMKAGGKRVPPLTVLTKMLSEEVRPDVGGYLQAGVVGEGGFRVCPIIEKNSENTLVASFLGIEAESVPIKGYVIGYLAVGA
ncbi:hypothetical protein [Pseudomonas mandelii]|uniref:hypothetical protein n=1 Tax=Pseudomonas mandelii TaxID=75612 RepID=UPI00029A2181|nr:hypothetical protein [Pseudomonas mandelii]